MVYSIIFNKVVEGKLESWLDTNEFKTMEEADEHGAKMTREWWEQDEEIISWMTFYHSLKWTTESHFKTEEK